VSASDLEHGRRSFAEAAWRDAYLALTAAGKEADLPAQDLELLARAAYMLGSDDDYVTALERAYRAHVQAGAPLPAVRCCFWIGHSFLFRGQAAPASGWFARGARLLNRQQGESAERGYVLIAAMLECSGKGDIAGALGLASEITKIGERWGDADLVAIGLMEQGHALVRLGRTDDGVRLIDETMVAVTAGELSPIVAGIVYCNTIAFCRGVYQLRRVREWTIALTRWCARQPDMVAHKGVCLVHRAETMTFVGAWDDAMDELQRFGQDDPGGALNELARGDAAYCAGDVHRLRGEFALAEADYRRASELGREPAPGLALMRLAQGKAGQAAATIRRALAESVRGVARAAVLSAYVEIMLAVADVDAASAACRELDEIAAGQGAEALDAMACDARAAVSLAEGDGLAALRGLRSALLVWRQLDAPYHAARCRASIAQACRLLGDDDSAAFEVQAARTTFTELGAKPDLASLEETVAAPGRAANRLSSREQEVLRLVAIGLSNRDISARLVLSEHTVARHLHNIFVKLGVSSRTAATAFAYEHDLV
jgi:DNA-binding NarL/FixJ family response regulator